MKILLLLITAVVLQVCPAHAVVQKEKVGDINAETLGIERAGSYDLPLNLWQGLSHQDVTTLLQNLPTTFKNPFWEGVQINFLASPMKTPENPGATADIFDIRFQKLLQMEAFEAAYTFGKQKPEKLNPDEWAWCQMVHFLIHNNYERAFKIAQQHAFERPDSKWQQAVIALQILMGNIPQAEFSLSILEKDPTEEDTLFIQTIQPVLKGETVKNPSGPAKPLLMKILLSHGDLPQDIEIEKLSQGMLDLIVHDKAFHELPARTQLSILEYQAGLNPNKAPMLKEAYKKAVTPESSLDLQDENYLKENLKENDPMVRAALHQAFVSADTDQQKKAFYAFYMNALENHLLPVAKACFGANYNYAASAYNHAYGFAFSLHNIMLGNASYFQAWLTTLDASQMQRLALLAMGRFDPNTLSDKTKDLLQEKVNNLNITPAQQFLLESKIKLPPSSYRGPLNISDYRLLDVIRGAPAFGKSLCILLQAASSLLASDIMNQAVMMRALQGLGFVALPQDYFVWLVAQGHIKPLKNHGDK